MRATHKTETSRLLLKVRPLASTANYPENLTPKGGEEISRTRETTFLGEASIEVAKPKYK